MDLRDALKAKGFKESATGDQDQEEPGIKRDPNADPNCIHCGGDGACKTEGCTFCGSGIGGSVGICFCVSGNILNSDDGKGIPDTTGTMREPPINERFCVA